MKTIPEDLKSKVIHASGKIGWAILWLLGVPLPILLILYACTGSH